MSLGVNAWSKHPQAATWQWTEHEGWWVEGVDRQFTHEGIIWGQRFTTSALVFTDGQDPVVLQADAAASERMATKDYPYLTASEAIRQSVRCCCRAMSPGACWLMQSSQVNSRSGLYFPAGIIGRFRSSTRVEYQGRRLQAKKLAEQFKPGRARYYKRLRLYAKRLTVLLPEVGKPDLIFVWYPHTTGFTLS